MFLPSFKSTLVSFALIFSLVLTIASVVLIVTVIPGIIDNEIFKGVELRNNTKQYDRFIEIPFPFTFNVYFFHVENPKDVLEGAKPIVKEVGPYVYKEYRLKTVIETNETEDTISYKEKQTFVFDQDASGHLSDNDIITTVNSPLISVLQAAEELDQSKPISSCIKDIFPNMDTIFINAKVKDLLFDGLGFCYKHFSLCEIRRSIVCGIAATKRNIDEQEDGTLKFSLLNYKNHSDDIYTVKRGIEDIDSLGQTVLLNNFEYTHFWERSKVHTTCDDIRGTYSAAFPPQITKTSTFRVFSSDICRSIELEFSNEDTYKDINGYTFAPNNETLKTSFKDKQKDCYCAQQTLDANHEKTCFLDGVVDMQPCYGAPVLLSFPHFLWADNVYVKNVKGIKPQEDLHKSFLTVEPDTGTPLKSQSRIQINTILRPVENVEETTHLPRVVFPLFWVEEGFSLDDKYIDELRDSYFHKVEIVNIVKWSFLGCCLILTLLFASYFIYPRRSFTPPR